jgi:hypothetical protein
MIFSVKQVHENQFDVVDQYGKLHDSFTKASSAVAKVVSLTAEYERVLTIL